jgi:hypothetical protein
VKPKVIRDVVCNDPSLKRVLKNWILLNGEIARTKTWRANKKVPWWYNERAAVGVLAGAVCRCRNGFYAFEEFIEQKHRTHDPSKKYKGRVDLHINLQGKEFIAEAKICWPKAETDGREMIAEHLKKAVHDAEECDLSGPKRLAIVFAALSVKKLNAGRTDELILEWLEKVKGEGDVRAWTFPRSVRQTVEHKHFHPGIAVFIRRVK